MPYIAKRYPKIYYLRYQCHELFDKLYPTLENKKQGYRDLGYHLRLREPCNHFSRMGEKRLRKAKRLMKKWLNEKEMTIIINL